MESNSVRVTIFGQTYTVNGDAPREYMLRLAEYLNDKMEDVRGSTSVTNPTHVAILAALNMADEYFQLKKIKSGADSEVEKRAMALISMLDQGLIGDVMSGMAATMKN